MPPAEAERRLAAILSADVAGYSRLMADDEDATVRTLRAWREQVSALIAEHRGRLADFTGDNFLAEFAAARDAVACALEIQRVLAARNSALPEPRRMRFRIGAHIGDVRHEDGRSFGDGVNVAARLQPLAEPGGLCISSTLADVVRGKLPMVLDDLGEQALKNIPGPVRAYRARAARDEAAAGALTARPRWLAPAAVLAITAIAAAAYLARDRESPEAADAAATASTESAALAPIRSLAVLPLTNLSGDPEQEYFADGMTETLIAELAKLPGVRVISRTSVMQFKGAKTPLPEIARVLSVDGVIEGSVMRAGSEVRITAQLIDARSDRHLWAEHYDRELARVLEIQSEVARAVAAQIQLALTPEQHARLKAPQPVDPRAQDAYFRGRSQRERFTEDGMRRAIEAFEEAIQIAPDYALAYAGLSTARFFNGSIFSSGSRAAEYRAAKDAALRAIELDPDVGDAHMALGIMLSTEWDFAGAEAEERKGIALGVSDPALLAGWAILLGRLERADEALAWMDEVVAMAPLDSFVRRQRASLWINLGRAEAALPELDRLLEINPEYAFAWIYRRWANEQLGRLDDAVRDVEAWGKIAPEWAAPARELRAAFTSRGREGYWRFWQALYAQRDDTDGAVRAYAATGDIDEAFVWLERLYKQRTGGALGLTTSPVYAPLRGDPRYADLLRRMNLPPPRARE